MKLMNLMNLIDVLGLEMKTRSSVAMIVSLRSCDSESGAYSVGKKKIGVGCVDHRVRRLLLMSRRDYGDLQVIVVV